MCRELRSLGYRVTAVDAVPALVDAAREADSADDYRVADATELPFATGTFELVVAYNMLMDVRDFDAAVAEISRVLAPTGRAVLSLVHPFTDRGRFVEAAFVIDGGYFEPRRFVADSHREGLPMRWDGWSRPLCEYTTSFTRHDLAITELTEPVPRDTGSREDMARWTRLPQFLWMALRPFARTPDRSRVSDGPG